MRCRSSWLLVLVASCLGHEARAQERAPTDDLEVPSAPVTPPPDPIGLQKRLADVEARLRALTDELAADRKLRSTPPPAPPPLPPPPPQTTFPVLTTSARPDSGFILDPVGIVLSGFLQAQYLGSQLSQDQLQQGGVPLNKDGFQLRLARLRLDGSWKWARVAFELSGNTVAGAYLGVLRAEASVLYRNPKPGAVPYVMATGGIQEMNYGYELSESVRRRPFMERTLGSLAMFPGSTDLGLRISGAVSFLRYALAAMNGVPLVERAGATYAVDLKQKDLLGRVGFDTTRPQKRWSVSGGVSFLVGTGFHAGTDATIGTTQWRDTNENGIVDAGELIGIPGRAATPSQTFRRWGATVDVQARLQTKLGWSQLYGEVTIASNLDRGLFPSDPIATGYDTRQLAAYLAVTQHLFKYGIVGFRWDYYDPDADLSDLRRGTRIPSNAGIHTLSPVVGLYAFEHLRLLGQYDAIFDHLARNASGVPVDLANNQWTVRLQGEF